MSVKTHHSTWIRIHVLELQITEGNKLCKDAHHLSHETKSQGVLGNALEQHRALYSHLACGNQNGSSGLAAVLVNWIWIP